VILCVAVVMLTGIMSGWHVTAANSPAKFALRARRCRGSKSLLALAVVVSVACCGGHEVVLFLYGVVAPR